MNCRRKKSKDGFIALISAIIISATLMAILLTANISNFFARFDALDTEYKRIATGLAEACANKALLKLAQDYSYDPSNETVIVGENSCLIRSITPSAPREGNSTLVTILTQGDYRGAFSNLQIEAVVWNPAVSPEISPPPPNVKIESWQETF